VSFCAIPQTGRTTRSCGTIRRGLTVPHPRHWEALASLA
jgi:hypothetical protein